MPPSNDHDRVAYRSFSPEFFELTERLAKLPDEDKHLLHGFTKAQALATRRAFYAFRQALVNSPVEDTFASRAAAVLTSMSVELAPAPDGTYTLEFGLHPFVRAVRRQRRADEANGRTVL